MRRLSDIICRPQPLQLPATASVREACACMASAHVGSVLVVDKDDVLVGIFTARDAVARVLAPGKNPAKTVLRDVMTPDPVTMDARKTAIDALRLMWDGGFRHVPVVERGRIIGVVSRGDFKAVEDLRLDEERELWEQMR